MEMEKKEEVRRRGSSSSYHAESFIAILLGRSLRVSEIYSLYDK
jgi:hypothetical protein